jgi:hypothetical protein
MQRTQAHIPVVDLKSIANRLQFCIINLQAVIVCKQMNALNADSFLLSTRYLTKRGNNGRDIFTA